MTALISPARKNPATQAIETLLKSRETGIVLALLLVLVVTTVRSPAFLVSTDGFRDLLLTPAIFVLLAIGQAMVIITRNIDLSVGSAVGLTAYLTGRLFVDFPGMPIPVVIIAGIALGALLGLINGALIAFAKVPALVVTLGTLYIYRGVDVWWVGASRSTRRTCRRDFWLRCQLRFLSTSHTGHHRGAGARRRRMVHEDDAWGPRALRDRLRSSSSDAVWSAHHEAGNLAFVACGR